jgi:hypothetical protein
MILSGICDAIGFAKESHTAAGQADYDQANALKVATLGALIGSGVVIGEMLGFAICTGPFAPIIAVLGIVLVAGGVAFAAWFNDSPYEEFCKHCFLGINYESEAPFTPDWSPHTIPSKESISKEVEVLISLLSHFQLEMEQYPPRLVIKPGMICPESIFEVRVRRNYHKESRYVVDYKIRPETKQYTYEGEDPVEPSISFSSNTDNGRVLSIKIDLEPARDRGSHTSEEVIGFVRLILNKKTTLQIPSDPDKYVYGYFMGHEHNYPEKMNKRLEANSTNPDHYSAD